MVFRMLVIVSIRSSMIPVVAWYTSASAATTYSAGMAWLMSTGYQDFPWFTAEVAEAEVPA